MAKDPAKFGWIDRHAPWTDSAGCARAKPGSGGGCRGVVGCFSPLIDSTFASTRSETARSRSKEAVIKHAPVAGCLILIFLAACDNVSWGGADVTIVPPPPKASEAPEPGVEPGAERLPEGPILYHVRVTDGSAGITPVAEISGDTLLPLRAAANDLAYAQAFVSTNLRQGSEFVLFRSGVRAGTFITQSATVDEAVCRPTPRGTGILELSEAGEDVLEFLAIARVQAPQIQRRTPPSLTATNTMRLLADNYADRIIVSRGFSRPNDWNRARARIQPFAVPNAQDPGFTATYLVGDTLGPGLDDVGHAVFFVAMPGRLSFDTVYVRLRSYAADGKAAPEMVDFLDWNRDDSPDLLLRVFGTTDTWFEAVSRDADGRWRTVFADRCERPEPVAPDSALTLTPAPTPPDTGTAAGGG